jgi:hypothetical protein
MCRATRFVAHTVGAISLIALHLSPSLTSPATLSLRDDSSFVEAISAVVAHGIRPKSHLILDIPSPIAYLRVIFH